MRPDAPSRRAVYFAFQGLFASILLLMLLHQPRGRAALVPGLSVFAAALLASLAAIRLVPDRELGRWWFAAALFLGDLAAATWTLSWTSGRSDLFLIYLLVVFGSALTRSARQSLVVAGVTIALYLVAGWRPGGLPHDSGFWLRALFLAVSSALMAILARDAQRAQEFEKRRYDERLLQVQRLATLGRVAGEVAHRIKGPLTTIAVNAEVLEHKERDAAARKELARIREEVERCKSILKDLLDLGRIEEMDVERLDLRVPVRRALRAVEPQSEARRLRVEAELPRRAVPVRGDAALLQEAVAALLVNALEASREGARVRLAVRASPKRAEVEVADDGAGIAPADLERVFEPFYTTKPGTGSGLGLSAALRVAEKHGGTVEAHSDGPGRGARFVLVLPR